MNLSPQIQSLQDVVSQIVDKHIAPAAATVDATCQWPEHSMKALAEAGLTGLTVPAEQGGHGQGLTALAMVTETIAAACPSSALCFGMHCVGTAVIAAKATEYQKKHYLEPIARGQHITTLCLSETGSGAHFYLPSTQLTEDESNFVLDGSKQFVTNGGHADSYVVSVAPPASDAMHAGDFSCVLVDADNPGLHWQDHWRGFGMRGNSSRGMDLLSAPVRKENLLGEKGDQHWYVFEVIAPFFLMAMAGTYVGIASAAVEATGQHLRSRRYAHSGDGLADIDALQSRYAAMWMTLTKTQSLLREAAWRGDSAHPDALSYILACKADASETAVQLTNEAMSLCGGIAYRENSRMSQMLRDARASHVMAPTTDLLKIWLGRALLGVPLL